MITCRLARAAALVTLRGELWNDASSLLHATFFGESYRILAIFEALFVKFSRNWLTGSNIRVTKWVVHEIAQNFLP